MSANPFTRTRIAGGASQDVARALEVARELEAAAPSSSRAGAAEPHTFDLATETARNLGPCYGIAYLARGSAFNGLLELSGGAGVHTLRPGDVVRDYFPAALLVKPSTSGTVGKARLVVFRSPEVDFREPPAGTVADTVSTVVGPAGATTQAYNVTTNVPSLVTDGVALPQGGRIYAEVRSLTAAAGSPLTTCRLRVRQMLDGSIAVRATYKVASSTISAATLVFWFYDPDAADWIETPISEVYAAPGTANDTATTTEYLFPS